MSRLKLKIVSNRPCTEKWEAMTGNARQRHCEVCNKDVYNFGQMRAGEVIEIIERTGGHFCARGTYFPDGSVQTLDGRSQASKAAGVVLAASLVFGATAQAQSAGSERATVAHLSGTVMTPDGSKPVEGAVVALISGERTVTTAKTDSEGNFAISAKPGNYDISIRQNVISELAIPAANLHAGEQSVGVVKTHVDYGANGTILVGAMESVVRYPISYLFKHPIRYMKNLRHNF